MAMAMVLNLVFSISAGGVCGLSFHVKYTLNYRCIADPRVVSYIFNTPGAFWV